MTKENIPKIADFGLSQMLVPGFMVTQDSSGTLSYAPPEVLEKKPHDFTADLWSMGVILYYMLAGVKPFRGPTPKDV